MVIIDTEFLFGLNEDDSKHNEVMTILDEIKIDIKVPASVIFEYLLVLLSRNKSIETIVEALSVLNNIFREFDMKILEFNFMQLINGLKLYSAYKFKLFDCLIAGTALTFKELLIGDDRNFKYIKEIKWQDYSTFINSLK